MLKALKIILVSLIISVIGSSIAFAQLTILPSAGTWTLEQCNDALIAIDAAFDIGEELAKTHPAIREFVLGCAIKTGRISFAMIPYFIQRIINFLLALVGLVSVLAIVIGGYFYVFGGLTDQKEKGKNYLKRAIMGLALASLSWIIVSVIISLVTS